MKITIACTLALIALLCQFAISAAYPHPAASSSIDKFDGDVQDLVITDNYRNSRLRRANYYGDYYDDYYPYRSYGYDSNPTPIRRADTEVDRAYKYTPLVRYKQTRTKRKKLFVPNLWG